jgi:hypothetical protein
VPFKPDDALTAVREIMAGPRAVEAERLDRIAAAIAPKWNAVPTVELPKDPTPAMMALARKSRTNALPLVLDTFSQCIKADGVVTADGGVSKWMDYWNRNQLEARQTGINRSTMQNGASYGVALPGDNGPVMRGRSARMMTAVYQDPESDEWPMMALDIDGGMIRLYDETSVYFIGQESQPRSGLGAQAGKPGALGYMGPVEMKYIERRTHGLGVCPVVRFRDRMLLEGEELFGIIEPLIPIQERLDETTFGLLVAQFYSAFKLRYVIGWVPGDEREKMGATAAEFWSFQDDTVKVGQFDATDTAQYLKSHDSALGDMAAIAQVPAQQLGVNGISNISADTLAALEAGKERKSDEMSVSLAESYQQWLRLASLIDGDTAGANDFTTKMRFKNTTARALGQTTDALVKWVQSLGVPAELARQWIPGWTDYMESEAARIGPTVEADPLETFLGQMDRQSNVSPTA